MIVFIHSRDGSITTNNLKDGIYAKKKRTISVNKVKVAQKPKRDRDLEYLGSLNIKILKNVI